MWMRLDAMLAQAVLLFAVLVAPTALAQTGPSWNRRITSVEIVPDSSRFCQTAADADPCGTATINGVAAQLGCEAQTATCTTPPFTTPFPGISLNAADDLAASAESRPSR
jgi:hypothetical protein